MTKANLDRAQLIRQTAIAQGRVLSDAELSEVERLEGTERPVPPWEQTPKARNHSVVYFGGKKITAHAAHSATNEIYLYGAIDETFGVSSKSVVDALDRMTGDVIVRVNSPGGDVSAGVSMFNAIERYKARGRVTVAIDGMAASIASYIAMAGDLISIADNAMLMIHSPWVLGAGNAAELRRLADILEKAEAAQLTPAYARQSGKSEREIRTLLQAETWMTADESLQAGFVDVIENVAGGTAQTVSQARHSRNVALAALTTKHKKAETTARAAKAAAHLPGGQQR